MLHETPPLDSSLANRKAFDAHLDRCSQCENNPMELCPIGAPLLRAAALEAAEVLGDVSMVDAIRETHRQMDEMKEREYRQQKTERKRPDTDAKRGVFYTHLNDCGVCQESIQRVCAEGLILLREAAGEAVGVMCEADLFLTLELTNGED